MKQTDIKQNSSLISIILPVKDNDPAQVKRAITSVLHQSWQDFEILLIDDGSKKSFAEEIDRIAATDPRIRCFHISSSGVSGARNLGIQKACGTIVTFLDGDDAFAPFCLEEASIILKDPAIDALWGGTCYVSETEMTALLQAPRNSSAQAEEELRSRIIPLTPERIHQTRAECIGEPFRFQTPDHVMSAYINRGIAARFIRKEVFADPEYLFPINIKMYEDTIWNLKMMNSLQVCYAPFLWYYYYNNEASVSNRFQADALSRFSIPLERIRKLLELNNELEYAAYTRFLMDSLRYICKCLYGHPDWNPAPGERKKLRQELYKKKPWTEIGTDRYRKSASKRDAQKAQLYRLRLLLIYWKLTWKNMQPQN